MEPTHFSFYYDDECFSENGNISRFRVKLVVSLIGLTTKKKSLTSF